MGYYIANERRQADGSTRAFVLLGGGRVGNAFCPTGAGGGVDPSCSPGEGGGGGGGAAYGSSKELGGPLKRFYTSTIQGLLGAVPIFPIGFIPTAIGLAFPGTRSHGANVAHEELKEWVGEAFRIYTAGLGPLAVKAIKAGLKHSPRAFRLLVKGVKAAAGAAKSAVEKLRKQPATNAARRAPEAPPEAVAAFEELRQLLAEDQGELVNFLRALRASNEVMAEGEGEDEDEDEDVEDEGEDEAEVEEEEEIEEPVGNVGRWVPIW
jgi:hypothetical protein